MSYEIYYNVFFIGGLVLAGIMLVVSVLLFFLLNIPHVFGDLTGRNARKAIENIRNQNASSGDKLYKTSAVNRERGKLTDKISPSGSLMKDPSGLLAGAMATEKLDTQELSSDSGETVLLNADSGETAVLAPPSETNAFQIEFEITYTHTEETIC